MSLVNDHETEHQSFDHDLALLVAELTDRLQNGKTVDIQQIVQEHPTCVRNPAIAKELLSLRGTIVVTDAIGSHEATAVAE